MVCGEKERALFLVSQAHSSASDQPSPSSSSSMALHSPSPSGSPGREYACFDSVPQAASSASDQPSPSSSSSCVRGDWHDERISSGIPSPSVSRWAHASSGKASWASRNPSLSSSSSQRSSHPSMSASPL